MESTDKFKLDKMLRNADDFYEAAKRCSFPKGEVTNNNWPLLIPEFVNLWFACELYLKTIALLENIEVGKIHKLHDIYLKIGDDIQNSIYKLWLTIDGNDIIDHDYYRKMFDDNLGGISDYFIKFRYEHEWGGSLVGGDGFLLQFTNVLRLFLTNHNKTLNRVRY